MTVFDADKYIEFRVRERKPKTIVFEVVSKKDGEPIGIIKWYPPWRHYCFFPEQDCVFSDRCLARIAMFVEGMNKNHNESRKVRGVEC